ncbi:hypothetical protein ABZV67_42125 [Streptomyces sp. NPDC005065]|uniref:hypothetical protein n=1 Tax=Streptomyces sp. NPDC005065 TaxID=3154461 RepID=UPI0033A0F380
MGAPIVVHGISVTGVRVVTVGNELAGLVADDHELIEALRRVGFYDAEHHLDDPHWIEWRGGRAHRYEPA